MLYGTHLVIVWVNKWIQFVLIRNGNSFPYVVSFIFLYLWAGCMLCSLMIERLDKEYRSKMRSEVQLFWGVGSTGSPYHFDSALIRQCPLYSSLFVTTCSSSQYVLLYVCLIICGSLVNIQVNHHEVSSSFSCSEIILKHMVRINFLKTAFQT